MKIIFLDFDGVCTSTLETPGSYLNHSADEYGPSPGCIKRLIKLCEATNARIVISSNWRKFDDDGVWKFNNEHVRNPLPALKRLLGRYCIGSLPSTRNKTKAEVLVEWLRLCTDEDDAEFVVFDDDLSEGLQDTTEFGIASKFVHTEPTVGLTDKDCEKAMFIFKEQTGKYYDEK